MEVSEPIEITEDAIAEANAMVEKYGEEGPDPADYGVWVPGIPALIESGLDAIGCADWLKGLILDGIVAGVGAVLGFVPQMLVLFIFLAIILLYTIALKKMVCIICIFLDFRYKITPYYCGIRSFCVTAKYSYLIILRIQTL